jgi:hypothetical protein
MIRVLGWSREAKRCAVESDRTHNVLDFYRYSFVYPPGRSRSASSNLFVGAGKKSSQVIR